MSTATLLKRDYYLLGKLVEKKEPEIADRLITAYLPQAEAVFTDLSIIQDIYYKFCKTEGLNPEEYVGALYKSSKVDVRRKFIAVILHLYAPQVFLYTTDEFIVKKGLATALGKTLHQTKNGMSMAIREVIVWEKSYEGFKQSVIDIVDKIIDEKLNKAA